LFNDGFEKYYDQLKNYKTKEIAEGKYQFFKEFSLVCFDFI